MKRLIVLFLAVISLLAFAAPDAIKYAFVQEPTVHQVSAGDYLSKISLHYYGTAKYWHELALINRAPDSDMVFPGESVLIPSKAVIEKLHRAHSISRVNTLVEVEKELYAGKNSKATENLASGNASNDSVMVANTGTDSLADQTALVEAGSPEKQAKAVWPFVIGGFGGLIIGTATTLVASYKRNEKKQQTTKTEDASEPDYPNYIKNRGERKYL
jgi:hypothetical protein